MIRTLTLVCLALLASITGARKGRCEPELFEYYNPHLGCHACDHCPPGTEPIINNQDIKWNETNGALTCYRCGTCPPGTFKEKWDHNKCTRCLSCDKLSRDEVRTCKKDKNTDCGKCRQGFHDIYRVQKGVEDTRTLCQPCHMAVDAPECAVVSTPTSGTKPTKLAKVLIPALPYKQPGEPDKLDKEVNLPVTAYKGDHLINYPVFVAVIAIVLICVFAIAGVFVYKYKQRHLHPRISQNTVESGRWPDSPYRPTTVNSDYKNLSPEASSSQSLSVQKHIGLSLGNRILQAVSPRLCGRKVMNFPNALSGDVTEDSCVNLLNTEIRQQKVCRDDFKTIQNSIGSDWKCLARELQITDPEIEILEMDNNSASEKIYQMLSLYEKKSKSPPVLNSLCEALEAIDRRDIVSTLINNHSSS